jgi:hypothetical protein
MKAISFGLMLAVGWAFLGCSAKPGADEEGDLGTVQQHFNESQCATATAVQTFASGWNYVSSTSYGASCNAIDVTSMGANRNSHVFYSGTLPTNATDCANTSLRTLLYDNEGGSWVIVQDTETTGAWSGSACSVPSITLGVLQPGVPWRNATTARTWFGTNFTVRQFSVDSMHL